MATASRRGGLSGEYHHYTDSEPLGSWKVWVFLNLGGWASVLSSRSAYSANRVRREIQRQASETNTPDDGADLPATP